ncbi:MAG: sulfatase [Promethearchaeota archaeon]
MKTNIIFILIDDLGWKDLSCYGSEFYETPNIDKIASEGMNFTNAYASCPVCSPSRASILTGKYPASIGLTNYLSGKAKGKLLSAPYIDHLPLSEKTIAQTLKENGYNTWHVGKWHLGEGEYYPENHGFDENIAGCHWGSAFKGYFSPWGIPRLKDGPKGKYLTDHLTDKAIELIKNNDGNPFFLNLWYYSVHVPIQAKPEIIKYYVEKKKKLGLDKVNPFEFGDFFPCEHKKDRRIRRRKLQSSSKYAAMVHSLDENIGRILKIINEIGESKNTVVIFTSDNGGLSTAEGSPTCNAPLSEGKGWMYEGGVREPLIIKWPGVIKPGSQCTDPVTCTDFYPTLLEIAEIDLLPRQHKDGISILPLLKGEKTDKYMNRSIFWHYPHYGNQGGTPGSSIRQGDYKLIEFFEDGRIELYNLHKDIEEENEISKDKPEIAEKLYHLLIQWRESVDAKIPQKNPDYYLK